MKLKLSLLLNIVLIAALAFGAYKVVFAGSVQEADDGRTSILVSASEREFLLLEMRTFLESVQAIVVAISEDDMVTVEELALKVGTAEIEMVPAPLFAKLPLEFKNLGVATHGLFDGVAMEAADMGDEKEVTRLLGELLLNCTGCHAGYRLDIEPAN